MYMSLNWYFCFTNVIFIIPFKKRKTMLLSIYHHNYANYNYE